MRILFVAMANSVHTARWINQLADQGWDIHLFPVEDLGIHPGLRYFTVHDAMHGKPAGLADSVRVVDDYWPSLGRSWPLPRGKHLARRLLLRYIPAWQNRAWRLAQTIRRLQPDLVHSLEIQHAGYLTLEARKLSVGRFPPWIVTNWGSDIYLFGRLAEHKAKIHEVLRSCDFYACECQRDVDLARALGFTGQVLPVLPNTGGFDLERISQLRQPGSPSQRRLIVLKGYQHWAGRALVGLRAIALCTTELHGYRVAIYSAGEAVQIAAELVSQDTGVPIEIVPECAHEDMLRLYGRARVYIGLSISDAISTSLLEAMVMGAFPIQSCTACADEWIENGVSGFIVPPEDPEPIAAAIRRAISDDTLVDRAAEINARIAAARLDRSVIQPQVVTLYEKLASRSKLKERDQV